MFKTFRNCIIMVLTSCLLFGCITPNNTTKKDISDSTTPAFALPEDSFKYNVSIYKKDFRTGEQGALIKTESLEIYKIESTEGIQTVTYGQPDWNGDMYKNFGVFPLQKEGVVYLEGFDNLSMVINSSKNNNGILFSYSAEIINFKNKYSLNNEIVLPTSENQIKFFYFDGDEHGEVIIFQDYLVKLTLYKNNQK